MVPALALLAIVATPGRAQDAGTVPQAFTLAEALAYAADHYPALRATLEETAAASAGVTIARAAWLPRLDSVWQTNRATVNNVTGLLLPQSVIPGVSGPPPVTASADSVWGSAVGALLSWEPFDFGWRSAVVRSAEAATAHARATEGLTRLDVQRAAATAFFAVAQAEQAVRAAEADAARRAVLSRAARVLVDNQLRPGADASRADAERAAAETRVILARQAATLARVELGRVLGLEGLPTADAAGMLATPPQAPAPNRAPAHPLLQVRQAAVDAARAHEHVLADTIRPRVFLQSSVSARGSGAAFDGTPAGGHAGLWPDQPNWAAGLHVVLPNPFEVGSVRAKQAASAALTRAAVARYEEARLEVSHQCRAAAAMAEAARAVAAHMPVQLEAARLSEIQARARYDAGLAGLVEVAEAQSLLAQAEYQDAVARVDVWRALLAEAVARGDLAPFVALAAGGGGVR